MAVIKVLVVDDSELIRKLLTEILASDRALEVVGTASDPYEAREKIKRLNPDVITLDIEMPRMDGITFLRNLMRLRPMPVVMVSTLTTKGAEITLEALEIGAVDFVSKPKLSVTSKLSEIGEEIVDKVKQAVGANLKPFDGSVKQEFDAYIPANTSPDDGVALVAIGASTGGTEATKHLLSGLPAKMPPIVVVQHMPAGFTASYARRLNAHARLNVQELTESGVGLAWNNVYVARGDKHMVVREKNGSLHGWLDDGGPVNRHKPSVDVLFESVALCSGSRSVGIILTGMGMDGARGLGIMRQAGALTIAQDERSSVVWGMPRIAIEQGAASEVLPLSDIGQALVDNVYRRCV